MNQGSKWVLIMKKRCYKFRKTASLREVKRKPLEKLHTCFYSAVSLTPQTPTLQCHWYNRVWLCSVIDTTESDSAVSMTVLILYSPVSQMIYEICFKNFFNQGKTVVNILWNSSSKEKKVFSTFIKVAVSRDFLAFIFMN